MTVPTTHINLVKTTDGTRLSLSTSGSGAPVLLVPGWPQSAYAWRHVEPLLRSAGRTVHVVEPRGFGASDKPRHGYDLDTAAADMAEVLDRISEDPVDVVAHDVGTWISHALAARGSHSIRSLVLVDAAIPGVSPPGSGVPDEAGNNRSWHFGFNRLSELPELLISGREREYLAWLFASKSTQRHVFDEAALDEYAHVLSAPGALTAGLDYYRELFSSTGMERARVRTEARIDVPVMTIGGDAGVGSSLYSTMSALASQASGIVLENCGHYVPEERPRELVEAALSFWAGLE